MTAKMSAEWWEAEARRYCELHIAAYQRLVAAEAGTRTLRAAIWGYFALKAEGREAQAEGLLRSALPDDYQPIGA